jgi:heme exporter protein D
VFGEEEPKIKASFALHDIKLRLTTAMSECVKNFFGYFTNAQLWGIVQRYKPLYRIMAIPRDESGKEPAHVAEKRRKVIRKWFIYALKFIRIKKKLFQFIRQKKRDLKRVARRQAGGQRLKKSRIH